MFPKIRKERKILKRIGAGRKVKEWEQARLQLKEEYKGRGITRCEAHVSKHCTDTWLSFAHRYKRRDPRCAHTFEGTILACVPCHALMEQSKELTEQLFNLLRP